MNNNKESTDGQPTATGKLYVLLSRLKNVKQTGDRQWQTRCPAHDDQNPSLSISLLDDACKIGVYCQAGCATSDVLAAIGLVLADLMPSTTPANGKPRTKKKIVATYDYRDDNGDLLFQVVRYDNKTFRQRRPQGNDWEWSVKGVKGVLYRGPELLAADKDKPVFVTEGEKDADRLSSLGLTATTNAGGAGKWKIKYAQYLAGRAVVILPDNDAAGRKQAEQVAKSLDGVASSVKIIELPGLPEKGDVSDWLDADGDLPQLFELVKNGADWSPLPIPDGVDGAERPEWEQIQKLLRDKAIPANAPDLAERLVQEGFDRKFAGSVVNQLRLIGLANGTPATTNEGGTTADQLVALALERFRIGRSDTDEPFAVENDGPNIAIMFRGSRDSLRSKLGRMYYKAYGHVPNSNALADALNVLVGEALDAEQEPTYLRLAPYGDAIILDLGDATGRCVRIEPGDWKVMDRSPVLFRRTVASGVFAVPERGGKLSDFRKLLNVSPESWPVLLGWQIAALIPGIEHAILLLGGQQGTAKTTTAKLLINNFDPSPAEVRSQPRESEQWAIAAAGSWGIAIDNVSDIPDWWSDALCRAVTGDAWLRRRLYSDGELVVLAFQRVVLLTSIDPGSLKGDLGDRVLLVDLEPIGEEARRYKSEIEGEFKLAQPKVLGALLDLLAEVLVELPQVDLQRKPRMADFGRVLAAMDRVLNRRGDWGEISDADLPTSSSAVSSFEIFMGQRSRIAETVIESDPVAIAVQKLCEDEREWNGTAGELLARLTPERPPKDWPKSARGLSGRLARVTPALKEVGVVVDSSTRSNRGRIFKISTSAQEQQPSTVTTSTTVTQAENGEINSTEVRDGQGDGRPGAAPTVTDTVTPLIPENAAKYGFSDGRDADDGQILPLTDDWAVV